MDASRKILFTLRYAKHTTENKNTLLALSESFHHADPVATKGSERWT